MNAISPTTLRPLQMIALTIAIASAMTACKREAATPPQSPVATTEPAAPATPPEPAGPPSHNLKPAADAIEATDATIAVARKQLKDAAAAAREKWRGKTFEEFEASVFKEPGENGKYIVNGDVAIADRKLLQEFFDNMLKTTNGTANGKLTLAVIGNGVDAVWTSDKKKQLTYCISDSFGARKASVAADVTAATGAWEQAANVDFIHVAAQDANCNANNTNVEFDVRQIDVNGEYLARAFFPNDRRRDRNVLIDNSSFELDPNDTLKLVGILRHELGHALGFRHEHTRPEAGTCFEDNDFKPITAYDTFSVMHYPQCNGGGDWSLTLTALDKAGAACVYGKGSNNNEDLNQCVYRVPDAPATGTQETKTFDNQSVAKNERKHYGPYSVKPGSIATVKMSGVGANPGDPDLYVRYVGQPDTTRWICRPYLSHADETCELEIPSNRNKIYVMVRGYAAGNYKLEIKYTKPD